MTTPARHGRAATGSSRRSIIQLDRPYTPFGERISQTSTSGGTTTTTGYYTYNDHSDVEAVTGSSGTTTATYGYTAYGQPVAGQFTGADKTNVNPSPTAQPFSS